MWDKMVQGIITVVKKDVGRIERFQTQRQKKNLCDGSKVKLKKNKKFKAWSRCINPGTCENHKKAKEKTKKAVNEVRNQVFFFLWLYQSLDTNEGENSRDKEKIDRSQNKKRNSS